MTGIITLRHLTQGSHATRKIACTAMLTVIAVAGCQSAGIPTKLPEKFKLATESTSGDELKAREAAEACVVTAEQMEQSGHLVEAGKLYEKALRHDPSRRGLSRRLAVLYDQQQQFPTAAEHYRRALEEQPEDPDLLNDYGYFQLRQNRADEAEKTLRQVLELAPDHERAKMNLAMTLVHQNRAQEAFEIFTAIVGPAAAHSNLGALHAKQGRLAEARHHFAAALQIDPNLPQAKAFVAYWENETRLANQGSPDMTMQR